MIVDIYKSNIDQLQDIINNTNNEKLEIIFHEDVVLNQGLIIHDNTILYSPNKNIIKLKNNLNIHNSIITVIPKNMSPYSEIYKTNINKLYQTDDNVFADQQVKNVKMDNLTIIGNFSYIADKFSNKNIGTESYVRTKNVKSAYDFYQLLEWDYRFDVYAINKLLNRSERELTKYSWHTCIKSNGITVLYGDNINIVNCDIVDNISGGIVIGKKSQNININKCNIGFNGFDGICMDDVLDFLIRECHLVHNGNNSSTKKYYCYGKISCMQGAGLSYSNCNNYINEYFVYKCVNTKFIANNFGIYRKNSIDLGDHNCSFDNRKETTYVIDK